MQDWKQQRSVFAAIATAPTLWLLLFFVIPLAIVWAYSFGTNEGLTTIRISGTFSNYAHLPDRWFPHRNGNFVRN